MLVRCSVWLLLCCCLTPVLAAENETSGTKMPVGPAAAIPHQYFSLIRNPAVQQDLKVTPDQHEAIRKVTDPLDLVYFRVRSMPGQAGQQGVFELVANLQAGLAKVLTPAQQARLDQIAHRVEGTGMLVRSDIANHLQLNNGQIEKIKEILQSTAEKLQSMQQEAAKDQSAAASLSQKVNAARKDEVDKVWALLSTEQQRGWVDLVGEQFDLSQIKPGPFKAPDFSPTSVWVNGQPLKLSDLEGKVTVVHFYAFGCSNCINNYPSYRRWLQAFAGRDVQIVGIHTPETQRERDLDSVRTRAAEAQLQFPILADNDKSNWSAWGNTMWPTVYLVDKNGYLRQWWQGELNWQGAGGEKLMQDKIEELLKE